MMIKQFFAVCAVKLPIYKKVCWKILNYHTANESISVLIEPVSDRFNLRRRSLYYGAMIRWIKTWRCEGKIHHCLSILGRFRPSIRYLTCPNRWWYVGGWEQDRSAKYLGPDRSCLLRYMGPSEVGSRTLGMTPIQYLQLILVHLQGKIAVAQ